MYICTCITCPVTLYLRIMSNILRVRQQITMASYAHYSNKRSGPGTPTYIHTHIYILITHTHTHEYVHCSPRVSFCETPNDHDSARHILRLFASFCFHPLPFRIPAMPPNAFTDVRTSFNGFSLAVVIANYTVSTRARARAVHD